jgi:CubicO group peptidase (beta-lactamase class C family)
VPLLSLLSACADQGPATTKPPSDKAEYFPVPDSQGGWRTLTDNEQIRQIAGIDAAKLDQAFDFIRSNTAELEDAYKTSHPNGGLLVVRHGWLVYEKYFGKEQHDAAPTSCWKQMASVAVGILMSERPDLFPDGLDQKVYTPALMPPEAFPLPDPRMADIKLGQLLTFTSGIRGNNPVYVNGKASKIDPVGPDGWYAQVEDYALGLKDGTDGATPFSTKTLWCEPGGGYSYASAATHNACAMLRHVTGMELQDYLESHVAKPLGWERWGFGYKSNPRITHAGPGSIALRGTDMLRFCYMMLHDGRWGRQQIVPKDYVRMATTKSPYNPHYPYSLQFNVNTDGNVKELPRDAYWKFGSGGFCTCVVPSLDLIIYKVGGRPDQFNPADSGIPEPPPPSEVLKPIMGGPLHEGDSNNLTAMIMVVNSLTGK